MNIQKRTKLEHYLSVFISVLVNGGLFAAMLIYITFDTEQDQNLQQTMVIDPVDQEVIDEVEEEIVEEVTEMQEMQDFTDFQDFDAQIDTDFEPEQEVVNAPTDTDINQLTELLSDIASPVVMSGMMPGRTALMRQQGLQRYSGGMGDQTEAAVQRALRWLQSTQHSNGSWNKEGTGSGNAGYTGLALLTFLSNGQTPSSAEFGETVSRAIRYLVESQGRDGAITGGGREVYSHPMATYALAEAYTMTGNVLLREPLERAIQAIIRGQMADGGFPGPGGDRGYRYGGGGRSDNSVNAWHVQALKACVIAADVHNMNIPELESTFQKAMDGMLRLSQTRDNNMLGFGYTSPGSREILTSAGALCLHLAGRARVSQTRAALNFITRHGTPAWGESPNPSEYGGTINLWYYTIQALFHNNPDGRAFQQYNRGMATALVNNQNPAGYWECFSDRGAGQGKVYNTTLAALGLMVYYRYLPTTQADRIQQQPTAQPRGGAADDDIITITL
ncbi:MAG: terpene cyclase/mutase family protein [Kiritimatiellae bacterium]|nr:terpene cyclase/mutase family protein [Kiritimatiellia bacterium]